jgi:hypothetical protein
MLDAEGAKRGGVRNTSPKREGGILELDGAIPRSRFGRKNRSSGDELFRPYRAWEMIRYSIPRALPWAGLWHAFGVDDSIGAQLQNRRFGFVDYDTMLRSLARASG